MPAFLILVSPLHEKVVEGAGFEPAKAEPADLQSAPVDRLGIPPEILMMVPTAGIELATY